jgi:hypothetical protein
VPVVAARESPGANQKSPTQVETDLPVQRRLLRPHSQCPGEVLSSAQRPCSSRLEEGVLPNQDRTMLKWDGRMPWRQHREISMLSYTSSVRLLRPEVMRSAAARKAPRVRRAAQPAQTASRRLQVQSPALQQVQALGSEPSACWFSPPQFLLLTDHCAPGFPATSG